MMKTKWDILEDRARILEIQAAQIRNELKGMDRTKCGLSCACGELLETEGDFARHFLIPDPRFLNLGDCPVMPRKRA